MLSGLLVNIMFGLATKLMSEKFISKGLVIALREISNRTHNTWDDGLVAAIRDEIAPDMQLEQPKDWVIQESTETITIPSEPLNLTSRKMAM